jgi:GNAT superfamily N-acetyltransferase
MSRHLQPAYLYSANEQPLSKEELLGLARGLPEYSEPRYEKYYRRNLLGEPSLGVVREPEKGRAVGMATLFPVCLRLGGERVPGAIAGDFVIESAHRSLGPALGLQRFLLSTLPEAKLEFVLAVPNALAEPVFPRSGYELLGPRVCFVKVLSSRRLFSIRLPDILARPLSWMADPLLIVGSCLFFSARSGRYVVEQPARFDERFDQIWHEAELPGDKLVERSAEILNWKYEQDLPKGPRRFHIFALTRAGAIAAYAVYERRDGFMRVYEAFWLRGAARALFGELARFARTEDSLIAFPCFAPTAELSRTLRRCGFVPRRVDGKLFVYVAPGSAHAAALRSPRGWYFLQGDLDL